MYRILIAASAGLVGTLASLKSTLAGLGVALARKISFLPRVKRCWPGWCSIGGSCIPAEFGAAILSSSRNGSGALAWHLLHWLALRLASRLPCQQVYQPG